MLMVQVHHCHITQALWWEPGYEASSATDINLMLELSINLNVDMWKVLSKIRPDHPRMQYICGHTCTLQAFGKSMCEENVCQLALTICTPGLI